MNIEDILKQRESWLKWKDIAPLREKLKTIKKVNIDYELHDVITIKTEVKDTNFFKIVDDFAYILRPWRKGPFQIFDTFIDSEWKSYVKYNLLEPYIKIEGKDVADIGCNNGYYLFRMLDKNPASLTGFDPSPLFKTQFDFINHFIQSKITYQLLGIEHVGIYNKKFDTIFCLGVLYHRSDPIKSLKSLKNGLKKGGELFLDTFMIDGDAEISLTPKTTYSKIPNIYFIPTINALTNWLLRAGFKDIKILEIKKTDFKEQRKTEWIDGQSLEDFLDPNNNNLTIEGYPAPKRVYIQAFC